jgi:MFS family permease
VLNYLVRKLTEAVPSPILALFVYAIAAGYSMSAIPLQMPQGPLSTSIVTSWMTAVFYGGLLIGTLSSKGMIGYLGHKVSFIVLQIGFGLSLLVLPLFHDQYIWLFDRFIAGVLVGGIFVVVESWLLKGSAQNRRKRLSVYMSMFYAGSTLGQLALTWFGANGMVPFAISASLLVVAGLMLIVLPNYEPEVDVSEIETAINSKVRVKLPALTGCFVAGIFIGTIYGLMPLQLSKIGLPQEQIGSLMAVTILGAMAVQPIVNALSKIMTKTLLMSLFALVGAMSIGVIWQILGQLMLAMFVLGMAVFAFYPIAVNLGSASVSQKNLVSASQQMLLTYSAGSILGPIVAQRFMTMEAGIFSLFFFVLIFTCIYMLVMSLKEISHIAINQ